MHGQESYSCNLHRIEEKTMPDSGSFFKEIRTMEAVGAASERLRKTKQMIDKFCIVLYVSPFDTSRVCAGLAQLAEQLICNQQVGSSSPPASTTIDNRGRFPSGQREQTVNLSATPSEVRILPSPPLLLANVEDLSPGSSGAERFLGKEEVGSSNLLPGSRIIA